MKRVPFFGTYRVCKSEEYFPEKLSVLLITYFFLESGFDSRKSRSLVEIKSLNYTLKRWVASPPNGFQNPEAVGKTF
jgi:hypothetical protein